MNNIVPEFLSNFNYANWSACMKNYLLANDLWDVIESTAEPPSQEEAEAEFKAWRKKNAAALHAIQNSCFTDVLSQIRDITSAKLCWDTLAKMNELKVSQDQVQPQQEPEQPQNVAESQPQAGAINQGVEGPGKVQLRQLREAIERGDLNSVKDLIHKHPDSVCKKIADFGRTALHVATLAGNTKIVEELVKFMSAADLMIFDNNGDSALIFAAVIGSTRIAEIMVTKKPELVSQLAAGHDLLPVTVACSHGHKETARYLYALTPFDKLLPENGSYGSLLLHVTISMEMYDISLNLLDRCPSLATTVNHIGISPLHEFASRSDLFPSGSRFVFWKRWIYSRIHVQLPAPISTDDVPIPIPQSDHIQQRNNIVRGVAQLRGFLSNFLEFFGLKQIYDRKVTHAYAHKILDYMSKHISTIDVNELGIKGVYGAFIGAIKEGVIEVVVQMIKANPNLLTIVDTTSKGILMLAVKHRQEQVFSLVYVLDVHKHLLISGIDRDKNNMLHIAAVLAPSRRLDRISGAALQMQRELQWYKEVESIMSPSSKRYINVMKQTPGEIFSDTHKQLMMDGEKWMKETATSSSLVGALIITIMFTAAFTVPGGNIQEGFPVFLHRKAFMVFIISDAISLFASSTSVLIFLGVLTSRYAEEDFLRSLPTKLIIGLSTLFISIAAMMVAFSATIILMLRGELNLVMPLVLLASVPVTLFVLQQFPLLVEIFVSTYGPGIFDKKLKYWY